MPLLIPASCLAIATIIGEAASEPFEGQVAVAKVLRNRMRLRYQSDGTLAGTVLWPYQFSLWNTQERGRIRVCNVEEDSNEALVARDAWLKSQEPHPTLERAVLYYSPSARASATPPGWVSRVKEVARIGRHIFYEDPNAGK